MSLAALPRALALAGAAAGLLGPLSASAQPAPGPPRPVISLSAGFSPHVFEGAGTGFVAMLRVDVQGNRLLILEPGAGFYRYVPSDGTPREYYLIEGGLQGQVPLGRYRPFAGIGIGVAEPTSGEAFRATTIITGHGAAGLRLDLSGGWMLRGEVRWRALFGEGHTIDYTVGVGRRV